MIEMELFHLDQLRQKPDPYTFHCRLAAPYSSQEKNLALYLLHICLISCQIQSRAPYKLQASSCLYLARRLLQKKPAWPSYTSEVSQLPEEELRSTARLIAGKYVSIVEEDLNSTKKYFEVIVKFSLEEYGKIAEFVPYRD